MPQALALAPPLPEAGAVAVGVGEPPGWEGEAGGEGEGGAEAVAGGVGEPLAEGLGEGVAPALPVGAAEVIALLEGLPVAAPALAVG